MRRKISPAVYVPWFVVGLVAMIYCLVVDVGGIQHGDWRALMTLPYTTWFAFTGRMKTVRLSERELPLWRIAFSGLVLIGITLIVTGCGGATVGVNSAALESPDERVSLQAQLDAGAGGIVTITAGRHLVGPGTSWWSLHVPAHTTVRGEPGAILVQARVPPSARMLLVDGPSVVIEDLELDGQRGVQGDVDEHRANLIVNGATDTVIRRVNSHDSTGDGIYVYAPEGMATRNLLVEQVAATRNIRNGITFGGQLETALVTDSTFTGNGAQQVDTEAPVATVNDVTLRRSVLAGPGFALTISGYSTEHRSKGWLVEDNAINGGINVVWAENVMIRRNHGINRGNSPIRIYRTSAYVTIADNDWTSDTTVPALGVIAIIGTEGGSPIGTRIIGNTIRALGPATALGIRAEGAGDLEITGNTLIGPGLPAPIGAGVFLRATSATSTFTFAAIQRNRIANWGGAGVAVWGNGLASLGFLDVTDNIFVATTPGVMPVAMILDFDDAHCAKVVQQAGNLALGGVTDLIKQAPIGKRETWGSGDRWVTP